MADNDTWEFYQDGEGLWRWRRTASNGRIVGSSSQGYKISPTVLITLEETVTQVKMRKHS